MSRFNLAAARHELGLSVTELAIALHLDLPNGRTFVREMESGKRDVSGPVRAAVELMIKERRNMAEGPVVDGICLSCNWPAFECACDETE